MRRLCARDGRSAGGARWECKQRQPPAPPLRRYPARFHPRPKWRSTSAELDNGETASTGLAPKRARPDSAESLPNSSTPGKISHPHLQTRGRTLPCIPSPRIPACFLSPANNELL
jgi:hypothetical protein